PAVPVRPAGYCPTSSICSSPLAKRARKRENALHLVYKIVKRLSHNWRLQRMPQADADGGRPRSAWSAAGGPRTRTVADAAAVLTAIVQRTPDPRDPATSTSPLGNSGQPRPSLPSDYTQFLNPTGLKGSRIGFSENSRDSARIWMPYFETAL